MKQPHGHTSTEWFFHQILKNGGVVVVVVGGLVGGGGVIRLSFQSNSNSQRLSLWCKKKIIVDLMKDLNMNTKAFFHC